MSVAHCSFIINTIFFIHRINGLWNKLSKTRTLKAILETLLPHDFRSQKEDVSGLNRMYGHIKIFSSQSKWDQLLGRCNSARTHSPQCGQISSCRPALVLGLDLATQSLNRAAEETWWERHQQKFLGVLHFSLSIFRTKSTAGSRRSAYECLHGWRLQSCCRRCYEGGKMFCHIC